MFLVQQVFTFEWVTDSEHDTRDSAEDRVLEIMDPDRPDTVRIVPVPDMNN